MKGLIIKDLMCLRKQRVTYVYIVVVVLVFSIMYVLSAKYGNLAVAGQEMMATDNMTEIDVKNLAAMALIAFMLLPIAMVGDVTSIFIADGKASFAKVSAALPLSIEKRVLAKYITIIASFGISVATDIVIALVLSQITDLISFADFFRIIISLASVLFIYYALVCAYMFVLGYGKEDHAQIASLLSMLSVVMLLNLGKVKTIIQTIIQIIISDENAPLEGNPLEFMMHFVRDRSLQLFIIAIIVSVLSYTVAVLMAKRKRGIV